MTKRKEKHERALKDHERTEATRLMLHYTGGHYKRPKKPSHSADYSGLYDLAGIICPTYPGANDGLFALRQIATDEESDLTLVARACEALRLAGDGSPFYRLAVMDRLLVHGAIHLESIALAAANWIADHAVRRDLIEVRIRLASWEDPKVTPLAEQHAKTGRILRLAIRRAEARLANHRRPAYIRHEGTDPAIPEISPAN